MDFAIFLLHHLKKLETDFNILCDNFLNDYLLIIFKICSLYVLKYEQKLGVLIKKSQFSLGQYVSYGFITVFFTWRKIVEL